MEVRCRCHGLKVPPTPARDAAKEAPRPTVQLRYPQMPPFWPAFVDVRFEADIQFGAGRNTPAPPALRFDVAPELPAGVALDADTGGIRGSPLMEQGAGRQYIVTARPSRGGAWRVGARS